MTVVDVEAVGESVLLVIGDARDARMAQVVMHRDDAAKLSHALLHVASAQGCTLDALLGEQR